MTSARLVRLQFTDGQVREFVAGAGQTVLDAGLLAGMPLLHQCRSGSCGACVATLLAGEIDTRSGTGSTLLPSEIARGQRLLCKSEASTDCTFQLAYAPEVGTLSPARVHAFVNELDRLSDDVVRLTLELAEDNWLEFRAGQYLRLKIPGTSEWRSYSPSSISNDLPRVEFLVRLIPGGTMSTWLAERCQIDDVLELEGPFGQFFLREPCRAPHIFIAGGTGIAPVMAMLHTIRRQGGVKPHVLVSFGCRSETSLFGESELELFAHWLPKFTSRISVEMTISSQRRLGNALTALGAEDFAHPNATVYVCGPPAMVEGARTLLQGWGVEPERIHSELFLPSNQPGEVS